MSRSRSTNGGGAAASPLSRRTFLQASLLGAGGLALSGCSTLGAGITGAPVAPGTVTFWDLFGGGDGVRMADMLTKFQQGHPELGFQHVTLAWGNPYYTKLSLATLGDQPPDVGVSHASRLPTFIGSNLLQELTPDVLAKHGLTPDKFSEKAMQAVTFNGKQYAVPLDTHPFVLFYNTDICKKAGLLDADGNLKSMDGPDTFVQALTAAQKQGERSTAASWPSPTRRPPTGGSSSRSILSWAARCWRTTAPRWSWTRPRRSRCSTTCGT